MFELSHRLIGIYKTANATQSMPLETRLFGPKLTYRQVSRSTTMLCLLFPLQQHDDNILRFPAMYNSCSLVTSMDLVKLLLCCSILKYIYKLSKN